VLCISLYKLTKDRLFKIFQVISRKFLEYKKRVTSILLATPTFSEMKKSIFYTSPWAIIASATFTNPAMLAPVR